MAACNPSPAAGQDKAPRETWHATYKQLQRKADSLQLTTLPTVPKECLEKEFVAFGKFQVRYVQDVMIQSDEALLCTNKGPCQFLCPCCQYRVLGAAEFNIYWLSRGYFKFKYNSKIKSLNLCCRHVHVDVLYIMLVFQGKYSGASPYSTWVNKRKRRKYA